MEAGVSWVALYPTSRFLDDLVEPFQTGVRHFLADLAARGCTVRVSATRRPSERAWLMHWAWWIARDMQPADMAPRTLPDGATIEWTLDGAKEMVTAYGLAYRPSLTSRHIQGRAIDMRVDGWTSSMADLYALGARHGVRKLLSDPPHWSDDGR